MNEPNEPSHDEPMDTTPGKVFGMTLETIYIESKVVGLPEAEKEIE